MKKALFLMTHEQSGYEKICNDLIKESHIDQFHTDLIYNHPDSFMELLSKSHKNETTKSLYLEVITQNHRISCKEISKFEDMCKIVYYITAKASGARLHGLLELKKRTPWAIDYNSVNLSEYLGLSNEQIII